MISKVLLNKVFIRTGSKKRILYTYLSDKDPLKLKHEAYISFLDENFIPSTFSHAYTKKRSIYTNAKIHLYNDVFIKIDVKDFFPSLNHRYLQDQMYYELNRRSENVISEIECKTIIQNCSINRKGLPLGLLTSPQLSNIYMKKFDGLLYGRLNKLGLSSLKYTRYADDIFISYKSTMDASENDNGQISRIMAICKQELNRCHLRINDQKTKYINLYKSNHVKIAGINIVKSNSNYRRLTVSRDTVKKLFFRVMHIKEMLRGGSITMSNDELNEEIRSIKGMHSFMVSIHKTGYSNILSNNMKKSIGRLGYLSLEEMISKMSEKN